MINKFLEVLEELINPYSPRIRNFKLSNISIKDRLFSLFMRNSMPYGISEIDTNKGKRLFFINREYKPIGFFGYNDFIFYENAVKERSFYYINEFSRIYFYDDQTTPCNNKYNLFLYLFKIKFFILKFYFKRNFFDLETFIRKIKDFISIYILSKFIKNLKYFSNIIKKISLTKNIDSIKLCRKNIKNCDFFNIFV